MESLIDLASNAPLDHLPILLSRLEEAKAVAWQRLVTPPPPPLSPGTMITSKEASALSKGKLSDRWFRRHAGELAFAKHYSARKVLFDEAGTLSYLQARGLC